MSKADDEQEELVELLGFMEPKDLSVRSTDTPKFTGMPDIEKVAALSSACSSIFFGRPHFDKSFFADRKRKKTTITTEQFLTSATGDNLQHAVGSAMEKADKIFSTLGEGEGSSTFGFCIESKNGQSHAIITNQVNLKLA